MFEVVKAMLRKIFGGSTTTAIADSMFIDATSDSFKNIWSTVTEVYDTYIVPFGVCILLFLFFYALVEKASAEGISYEVLGKMLCQLLLLCGFMEVALNLALLLAQLASLVTYQIKSTVVDIPAAEEAITACIKVFFYTEYPVWGGMFPALEEFADCFLPIFLLSVPWLITIICEFIIRIAALMRKMEIFARATFFPVAIGDSYGGMSSSGVRYVKSFLAICLQGAVVMLLLRFCDHMCAEYLNKIDIDTIADMDSLLGIIIMPIVFRVATTAMVLKSWPLAKEICGAH